MIGSGAHGARGEPAGGEPDSGGGSTGAADPRVGGEDFRAALRNFASGVTVISCQADGIDHAMTASAFTAVSKEPPLVLVCVSRSARFNTAIRSAERWGVSILSEEGEQASRWLATPGRPLVGQLDRVPHTRAESGVALLSDSLVQLECRTREIAVGGDHDIVVGLVERVHLRAAGLPLIYWQGGYRVLAPPSGNTPANRLPEPPRA